MNELLQQINRQVDKKYLSNRKPKYIQPTPQHVKELITNLLLSKSEGHYIFDRSYGLGLDDFIFELDQPDVLNKIKERILIQLKKEFTDVKVNVKRVREKTIQIEIIFPEFIFTYTYPQ